MKDFILIGMVWGIYLFLLLPYYIRREEHKGRVEGVTAKMALSGTFCVIGFLGVIRQNADLFSVLIFLGLFFSMIGDYYLAYIKSDINQFIKGVYSFGAAQIFTITALTVMEGIGILEFLITAGLLAPCVMCKEKKKPEMGKAEVPLTCYFTLVTFMAVKAVLMSFQQDYLLVWQLLLSAGAFLFFVSDVFLGTWRFLDSKKIFSYVVSICYFTGQLLIATAILIR